MKKLGVKAKSAIAITMALTLAFLLMPIQGIANAQQTTQIAQTMQAVQETVQPQAQEQQEQDSHLPDYTEMYGWERPDNIKPLLTKNNVPVRRAKMATFANTAQTNTAQQNFQYLAILIEFPDQDMQSNRLDDELTLKAADMVMNTGGVNETAQGEVEVVSLKDYLLEQSYQTLNVETSFFPKTNGKVVSYVSKKPRTYYMTYNANTNPDGYSGEAQQAAREKELLEEVLQAVAPSIEQEFSGTDLDSNNDGYIDAISFFVEGKSDFQETGVVWSDLLWSHKTTFPASSSVRIAGKRVGDYNLNNTKSSTSAGGTFSHRSTDTVDQLKLNRASYTVIHHEFLHTLGLPDLYRGGNNSGDPVGFYDIMASNNGQYPQPPLTLLSREMLQWGDPIPEMTKSGSITIHRPQYTDPGEVTSYKIYSPLSDEEYFIVQFYEKQSHPYYTGRDDGFIIYRVNTNLHGNMGGGSDGTGDNIFVFRPDESSLGAGQGTLKNAVVLPTVNNSYGKTLNEVSVGWDRDTLYYTDGSNSGIKLTVTASTNDTITLDVTVPDVQGSGTAQDPYLISTVDDWKRLVRDDKHVKIMKDIDFSGTTLTPIPRFSGSVDGNGKTLSNIKVNGTGLYSGLFESVYGSISDLTLSNLTVTGGTGNVGGLAGQISAGNIHNVVITSGSVTAGSASARVGGFVGYLATGATISDCYTSIAVSGGGNMGGFIGISDGGTVTGCFANGSVAVSNNSGGFLGMLLNTGPAFTDCAYDMRATGQDKAHSGGDATGVTGYKINEKVSLDLNGTNEADLTALGLTTKPFIASISAMCRFDSTGIANFDNDTQKVYGVTAGTTNMYVDIAVGSHKMPLTTVIEVTDSGAQNKPITNVAITPNPLTMAINTTQQLHAELTPADTTDSKVITWESKDKNIATVDTNGVVTAVGKGSTMITATTSNGIQATCQVTVTVPITAVEVTPPTLTLEKNKTHTLNATVTPVDTTDNKTVTWSSSNENIVKVNATTGEITAVAAGKATVTATTANGIQDTCEVTVTVPITGITLDQQVLNIERGNTATLQATITPNDTTESKTVTWKSGNEAVATVDQNGLVTAKGKGSAVITATASNGMEATCTVTVTVPMTGIEVTPKTLALTKGASGSLTANLLPADTSETPTVTWSSDNQAVATVNSATGEVTAAGPGVTTIRAKTDNGFEDTCEVTVTVPMTGITINQGPLSLHKGDKETLTVTFNPADTTDDKTITWSSDNEAAVTVDSATGEITAVGAGKATITATAANGATSTCEVTVTVPMTSITVTPNALNLAKGATSQLTVEFTPTDTTDTKTIQWESDNPTVATVDSNGLVTAHSAGTANIKATVNNLTSVCAVNVTVPSTGIAVSQNQVDIVEGRKVSVTASLLPADTTDTATYVWSSADDTIATVDQSGNITGVKEGTTQITVSASVTRSGAYTAAINVTVSPNAFVRLQNKYTEAQGIVNGTLYPNAPQAFVQALQTAMTQAKAQLQLGEGVAADTDLNQAYDALNQAVQYFAHVEALNEMQTLINTDLSKYDTTTTAAFTAQRAQVQQILQDPVANIDAIQTVLQDLKTAMNTMVLLDSSALQQGITAANNIVLTEYLDGAEKDTFAAQLTAAQTALANATTNAEYQAAATALEEAIKQLEAVRRATDAQKAQIQAGITQLQAMLAGNTYSAADQAQIRAAIQTAQQQLAQGEFTANAALAVINTIAQASQLSPENPQGGQTTPDTPPQDGQTGSGTTQGGQTGSGQQMVVDSNNQTGGQMANANGANQQNAAAGNVQTGDTTALWGTIVIMILAVCGITVVVMIKIKAKWDSNE